ncbi:hypothetical protein CFP56_018052 [Quercus suber]|uniref:Protein FAR1-RELATED SEQUENCE n=1 Tax=Quercus suber TaxID=58331 RepID=A0AAW0KJ53_QUESU
MRIKNKIKRLRKQNNNQIKFKTSAYLRVLPSHTEGGGGGGDGGKAQRAEGRGQSRRQRAEGRGRGRDAHFFSLPSHIIASLSSSKQTDFTAAWNILRHQITVLFHMKIDQVPNKYILKRWCNNIKRSHTKVRINYDNRLVKPKTQRFDKMYKVFNEVADLAVDSDDKCEKVVARILELKGEFKQEKLVCGSNEPIFAGILTNSTSCGDDLAISKETKNILGPVMVRQKGRPPSKRKQSIVEKVVRKKEERKKKKKTKISERNEFKKKKIATKVENVSCTTPTMGLRELELQQSQQIGKESYEESTTWPNINCPPNIIGMSPYYGLPNMLQGGNSPFQSRLTDDSPLHKACYDLSNEHPSNSIGKFGTNDVTKFGNPKLHEDGRGN